jgi:uncharacterized protein YciW
MTELTRLKFIVEVDIERAPSAYMMTTQIRDAIRRKLSPKKLNYGDVRVYARQVDQIEEAALALAHAIVRHAEDKSDSASSGAVDRHESHYNHRLID